MKRFFLFFLIAGIALAAMSAYQYWTRPGSGDVAPGFSLPTLEGETVALAAYAGRPVLLHFWASWCGPCVHEFPSLIRLQRDYGDLAVLAIAEDGSDSSGVARFAQRLRPPFPLLIDRDQAVADLYQSYGVPESILIDRQGRIAWRGSGAVDWQSPEALQHIDALIQAPVSATPSMK